MFKKTEEGLVFISSTHHTYSLLEGFTLGTANRRTSDMVFVVLEDDLEGIDDTLVDYFYGAGNLESDQELQEVIAEAVQKYETENHIQKEPEYLVIDHWESKGFESYDIMWDGDDLEEAKRQARDFAYINKRDNPHTTTFLVLREEWEDGNYNEIDFTEEETE